MIKVTITPKVGKPVVKRFHTPQESIEFINSFTSQGVSRPTKRAADGLCTCRKNEAGEITKYHAGCPAHDPANR